VQRLDAELPLENIVPKMESVDIVLTEGYKGAETPKIEVFRQAQASTLVSKTGELLAIVSDRRFDLPVPQYDLEDAFAVADLLEAKCNLAAPHRVQGKESDECPW
jgi:molybdopterin-guanine dinucleotide biosynthesis protein B